MHGTPTYRRFAAALLASTAVVLVGASSPAAVAGPPPAVAAGTPALDGTQSPQALLAQKDTEVVVALFSLPGCPYCEVVRRNYLRPLVGEVPGVRIVEYGIDDERAFDDGARPAASTKGPRPSSAAALAESLGIRLSPTVVFLGEGGNELAERLVGYNSPDFYGAYLDRRMASALARAREK